MYVRYAHNKQPYTRANEHGWAQSSLSCLSAQWDIAP